MYIYCTYNIQFFLHTVIHYSITVLQYTYLDSEVVSGEDVAAAVAELDVRYGGNDLRKEGACAWILWLFKH